MTTNLTENPSTPAQIIAELRQAEELARRQRLIALLESWVAEDAAEDPAVIAAEWEAFKQAIDENRLSYRKLYS